jgi:hypothetical protein
MSASMRLESWLAIFGVLCVSACGGATTPASGEGPGYPTHVSTPSSVPGNWALDQEVTITHAEGENSFRAVLQKQGDQLTMVALGPHGGRAFQLTQTGTEFEWETFVPIELPFPPEYMLYDVHRTLLSPNQPPVDGSTELVFERYDERVTERWRDSKLYERIYERLDGSPSGTLVARYPDGLDPNAPAETSPPPVVTFENGWHGYVVTIRTLSYTPITAP